MEEAFDIRFFIHSEAFDSLLYISSRRLFLKGEIPVNQPKFDDGTYRVMPKGNRVVWYQPRKRQQLACFTRLDHSQHAATAAIDKYPVTLTQGPPGTGKTSTIITAIPCCLTGNDRETIMVTAPKDVPVKVRQQNLLCWRILLSPYEYLSSLTLTTTLSYHPLCQRGRN